MKKIILKESDFQHYKIIAEQEFSTVFQLKDGSILKLYEPSMLNLQKCLGFDTEEKILDAVPLKESPEILVPTSAVYTKTGDFCGYTMPCAKGISFNNYYDGLTPEEQQNLEKYAQIHYKLESVLRRNQDIVFPDFCTCDNIFIDDKGNVQFIDYDGLQVGSHKTMSISTCVEDCINNPKYMTKDMFFTKELDKKSSIILFYLAAFNVNLNNVGMLDPQKGTPITLEDVFKAINLNDPDLCHKTYKIFHDDQEDEFLDETILSLADKYDVQPFDGLKRIVKKK